MQKITRNRNHGFTLVEIMIVVAIIALLAAIAVPNFLRARKRSQATRILNDLRQLESAVDQYSVDTGKTPGFVPDYSDIQKYLKPDTDLYTSGVDLFGDSYGPFAVDSIPQVPTSAFNTLSDVADADFWGRFYSTSASSDSSASNPYAQYNGASPMDRNTIDSIVNGPDSPINQLNQALASGQTPSPQLIAAAQQLNQQLNQVYAQGGFGSNSVMYTNAISNNFQNGTVSMKTYMTKPTGADWQN